MSPDSVIRGLGSTGEFPELRRLFLHGGNLKGERSAALARMKGPKLIDLWLCCEMGLADVKTLAASPLFAGLRVLTFDKVGLTHTALAPVAGSGCAPNLRILRILHASMNSLAKSALARPGAFPSLTSLVLESPFASSAKERDTASLLARLDTPRLRHLALDYCDFDDACADLLATNPVFAGLTRLVIRYAASGATAPRPETMRKLLRSGNLRTLVVLEMWGVPVGDAPEVLADATVMPNLSKCVFAEGPRKPGRRLEELRAGIRCVD
jgi:hypothetical protein